MSHDAPLQAFTRALLDDIKALERMLESGVFESERRRIGAEQEMFLVDAGMRPAPVSTAVLADAADPRLTTELARFNLEANASPIDLGAHCLSQMEAELRELVTIADTAARKHDARVVLTGILPTLRKSDLELSNMTPTPRYSALNDAITAFRGGRFDVTIRGTDELHTSQDSVMLESCNTSFQLHMQVTPDEFASRYNAAQLIAAPVLAVAVNSPVFLGKRLWSETRIALFQRGVDSRSDALRARGIKPRVGFGDGWVKSSVLEIFREQVARFRVVFPIESAESSLAELDAGRIPQLSALARHNGTVYRWNRACYGVNDGVPHLRIEARALPAGPTITDEVANAALHYGLLLAVPEKFGDVSAHVDFDEVAASFVAAARRGLLANVVWADGSSRPAKDLLLSELLPLAREGLSGAGVGDEDIDRYLGIIRERAERERTGAKWLLSSLATAGDNVPREVRERAVTAAMLENQTSGLLVHEWPLCDVTDSLEWRESYRTVGQFMSTDLFTVREGDLVDLAASVMDWRHIKHVPVEDDSGSLVGVISYRTILRLIADRRAGGEPVAVRDLMKRDVVTVGPNTPTLEAMHCMRDNRVGCLPVVDGDKLVGIITQSDLIKVSARLLERYLAD